MGNYGLEFVFLQYFFSSSSGAGGYIFCLGGCIFVDWAMEIHVAEYQNPGSQVLTRGPSLSEYTTPEHTTPPLH